ncbi:hypothetical protein CK203_047990 [Vitis vinifera]|uniref:Uncharacterized protein n=1 Tax=Vitis vinifera TaxID=29760 RepID=A0A438GH52_VITVI|nr:hypothetical protein CK203_047990 [Vitis vinifera]
MTSSASKVGGSGLVKTVEIEGRGRALVASQSLRGGQSSSQTLLSSSIPHILFPPPPTLTVPTASGTYKLVPPRLLLFMPLSLLLPRLPH